MATTKPLAVQICDINAANLKQLRVLNISTLPVRYTDKFYKDLLTNGFAEYLKFASWNGFAVAAVCARIERHETEVDSFKLYIMTINVLPAYRRRGIGAKLLEYVLETAKKDLTIIEVYLHVQTSNLEAKLFYLANGFVDTGIIKDYYKRIEPPDCFLLKKSMKDGHHILPISSSTSTSTSTLGVTCSDDVEL